MAVLQGQGHSLGKAPFKLGEFTADFVDTGQDSVDPAGMTPGLAVYCGYQGGAPGYRRGSYSNMTAIKRRFPGKKYICVGTDAIDIEPGLASPADAPAFVRQWHKDKTSKAVVYASASQMDSVKSYLNQGGISRSDYFLWVARWNGGGIPAGFDAIQNGNTQGYDSDLFEDYMFAPVGIPTPPPPPPKPPAPTLPGFSITPHVTRTVLLDWAPPVGSVDHFVIVCSPASPDGVLRPPGNVRSANFRVPATGPVAITITAINALGDPSAAKTVHV